MAGPENRLLLGEPLFKAVGVGYGRGRFERKLHACFPEGFVHGEDGRFDLCKADVGEGLIDGLADFEGLHARCERFLDDALERKRLREGGEGRRLHEETFTFGEGGGVRGDVFFQKALADRNEIGIRHGEIDVGHVVILGESHAGGRQSGTGNQGGKCAALHGKFLMKRRRIFLSSS